MLDKFDWTAIGIAIVGIIIFVVFVIGKF